MNGYVELIRFCSWMNREESRGQRNHWKAGQFPIFYVIDLAKNNDGMPVAEGSVSVEKRYMHEFLMPD